MVGRGIATVASLHPRERKGLEPLPSTPPGPMMTSSTGLTVAVELGLENGGIGVLMLSVGLLVGKLLLLLLVRLSQ